VTARLGLSPSAATPFNKPWSPSLIIVLVLFLVWVSLVLATSLDRLVPAGFRIRVIRPGVITQSSPGLQPLRIRVTGDWQAHRLFVGTRLTPLAEFGAVIREEMKRRPPDWPVYVEGDPDLEWRSVVEAIDVIQGQGAEAVLLTASTK